MNIKIKLVCDCKVRLIIIGNRLEVVPVHDIKEARGFLKGMSSDVLQITPRK